MQPDQGTPARRPEHNIAMWGAPASGKTTFLAALNIALRRKKNGWIVVGADDASTDILNRMTAMLATERTFPQATLSVDRYRWFLVGQTEKRVGRRFWRKKTVKQGVKIGLDLLDPSGEIYGRRRGGVRDELVANLVKSRGIVFLFDPVREFEDGDAFEHLHGMLSQLAQQMLDSPDFEEGRLPHYLAVCVTKFDEIRVLETAEKLKLTTLDPDDQLEFPRVDTEDAQELFEHLCGVSATGNAEMVLNTLELYFRPERIKYFITSAIGFHVDPRIGVYDPDDFQNLIPESAGSQAVRIRGMVHPINVMEPLLWLGQQLSSEERS